MRLNRYLSSCGLGSRRGCESLIQEGRVSVGGKPCTNLSHQVTDNDLVAVDGKAVHPAPAQTIAFYKPRGLLTTSQDELGRETIYHALPDHLRDLKYIGRLDQDSEGLLILTRDGDLAQALSRPSSGVEKEYLVTLDQAFDQAHGPRLLRGIRLEEGTARARSFRTTSPRRIKIVLTQGMKRQIRRMFEAMGYRVKKLVRTRIGSLTPETLEAGRWRPLGKEDIAALQTNPTPPPKPPATTSQDNAKEEHQQAKKQKIAADKAWKRTPSASQLQKRRRRKGQTGRRRRT